MIRNIVFDMGNCLIYFNKDIFLDRVGAAGEDRELLKAVIYGPDWERMDSGELDEADALALYKTRLPERLWPTAELLTTRWDRPILPVPGMADIIQELKRNGYKIWLLSNASRRQHEYWPRVPGHECFDGTLISADVLMMKPHHDIYEKLYETFSLDPAECLFIDDNPANAAASEETGMKAVIFRNDAALLRRDLAENGINICVE